MTVPGWPELGYTMIAFVGISVELTRLKEVSAKLASMDEFYWLAMTTGDYDLLGQIVLSTNNDVAEFVSERVAPIEGIRNFRILVAPTFYKPSWDYRLPEPSAPD